MDTSWNVTTEPMQQRSAAWHEFRKLHIGASEVPTVMGESDFQTVHGLWLVKTGKVAPFAGNFATQRGIDAEPIIKRLYEEKTNQTGTSPVLEYSEWPTLSASLDWLSDDGKLIAEFKYPSAKKHDMAERGTVPETYRAQLQAQMLVAGVHDCDYVSFNGESIAIVRVCADPTYQADMLEKCKEFWELVTKDIEPELPYATPESPELETLTKMYLHLHAQANDIKARMESLRKTIIGIVPDQRAKFYGVALTRSIRKGNIDYTKIPTLKGVDLEPYRKKETEVVTLTVASE